MSARGRMGAIVLMLAAAFTLCVGEARAQTADVCRGGAPTAGERIACSESDGSTDITINITDFDITTDGIGVIGIFGLHSGTGDIDIDVRGGTIRTQGTSSGGIYATQRGTGDIDIDVRDATIIVENNNQGIFGDIDRSSVGRIRIYAENVVFMTNDHAI